MAFEFPFPTLRENVYATLVYFDLSDYPLTLKDLEYYLLGPTPVQKDLEHFLEKEEGIGKQDGYYFLKGRGKIVGLRQERAKIAEQFWYKVQRFVPFLQMVPFLKLVAVCNTLAFDNPTKESDIDLFIVTRKGRIFVARTLATLLFSFLGIRRHGQKIAGQFCLSFYVTEEALNLRPIRFGSEDIYLPYWILMLKPLYGKEAFTAFLKENRWISTYFDNHYNKFDAQSGKLLKKNSFFSFFGKIFEFLLDGRFGDYLEKKISQIQQKRHQQKEKTLGQESSVIVSSTVLKFHNVDRRKEISALFQKRLQELKILPQ